MTSSTKSHFSDVEASITDTRQALQEHVSLAAEQMRESQKEIQTLLSEQREEILRLRLTIEQLYKNEKRRRIAAKRHFKSE